MLSWGLTGKQKSMKAEIKIYKISVDWVKCKSGRATEKISTLGPKAAEKNQILRPQQKSFLETEANDSAGQAKPLGPHHHLRPLKYGSMQRGAVWARAKINGTGQFRNQ